MDIAQMKDLVAQGQMKMLESAWLEAMERKLPVADMAAVLENLVKIESLDMAEMLALLLLEDRCSAQEPHALEVVKALVTAVAVSDELRQQAAEMYRKVHAGKVPSDQIATLLEASGLLSGQSPRRAFRTLDTCLAIRQGTFLASRFDHRVLKASGFNGALGEFELADAAGKVTSLDPKALADEFDVVDPGDFRVLATHRPQELRKLLDEDPAGVLVGICLSSGGSIDSNALKDRLCPRYISAQDYSSWWSKARTAAKRSPVLGVEGRSPVLISYHPHGRTLEDELQGALAEARTPLDKMALLWQYMREARDRKITPQASFTAPILSALANEASRYQGTSPTDALAASLAIQTAAGMGLAAPQEPHPTPQDVLAKAAEPAEAIAQLAEPDLWPLALDALAHRADGANQLAALVERTHASVLDELAARLKAAGRWDAIEQAASAAAASPLEHLEVALWLWKGPADPPAATPGKVELLGRILKAMTDLEHDWHADSATRKKVFQRVRSALSAADFAAYRQAVTQMTEAVADTIKRLVERASGLAQAVRDEMLGVLRESFFALFVVREKVQPWADETTIWTTERSLHQRQEELKQLTDVKMLENARAIGAAAAHGDLSENSEWKFALEERDMLQARAAKMQDELSRARVLRPDDATTEAVGIGSRVTLRRAGDSQEVVLTFLGPWESDLPNRVYSYKTPLAQEFMGQAIGQSVHTRIDGQEDDYLIERIESALPPGPGPSQPRQ